MSAAGTDERLVAACARAAEAIIARPIEARNDCDCEACGSSRDRIATIIAREMAPLFAEAAADTARLDWCDKHDADTDCFYGKDGRYFEVCGYHDTEPIAPYQGRAKTFRAAIDKARGVSA